MRVKYIFMVFTFLLACNLAEAYENSIYIWQRSWHPEIKTSIDQVAKSSDRLMVLAGDLKVDNNRINFSKVTVNWEYLRVGNNVGIDIRMRTDISRFLRAQDQSQIVEYLIRGINGVMAEAKQSGVDIKDIELDYDCPTSKLDDFARFLKALRQGLQEKTLSITALPTWLASSDFSSILIPIDYYVLQLHSFELPKDKNAPQYIFPKDRAIEYLNRAVELNKSFYISLPTYGYEVAYSKDDEFIGLRAEGGVQYFADGIKKRMMFANPNEIVKFLAHLSSIKSDSFLGVCWFRLPVSTDRFNWDIKTFQRVVNREVPLGHLSISAITRDNGIREFFIVNDGEMNFSEDVDFYLTWGDKKPLYDILSGFDYSELPDGTGVRVIGKAPRVSYKKMIAWFRMGDASKVNILNSEVRTYEKN